MSSLGLRSGLAATFFAVPPLSIAAGVFRIVVLLKPVTIWIIGFQKWKQPNLQYINIMCCCQCSTKYNYVCSPTTRNSCPYVSFGRMFGLHSVPNWLPLLARGNSLMTSSWTVHSLVHNTSLNSRSPLCFAAYTTPDASPYLLLISRHSISSFSPPTQAFFVPVSLYSGSPLMLGIQPTACCATWKQTVRHSQPWLGR